MQKIIIYTVIMLVSFMGKMFAQEKTFEERANKIANQIETITTEEKKALKAEIEVIDSLVENGKTTKEKAKELKLKIAQEHATNIETKIAIEEEKLNQLIQDKVDGKVQSLKKFMTDEEKRQEYKDKKTNNPEKRTTSQFVTAMGFNNLVTDGQLANSDFGYLRSAFWEWGLTQRTNVFKNSRVVNFKYGVSFMYNNLTATDNRYFVENGNQTVLQEHPVNLIKNNTYFKNVYVTVPLHLEFDFSKEKMNGDRKYYISHTGFRFGIGGFVGYNINSKQFLEYKEDGYKNTIRQKGDWNVNDWNYGLSTYIGYRATSLYLKYDINPLFKNNTIDQNNISLGLRFDFN